MNTDTMNTENDIDNDIPDHIKAATRLEDYNRENIAATLKERNQLSVKVLKVAQAIELMKAAGLPAETIQDVKEGTDLGAMQRYSYLEQKLRLVALLITRAKGHDHWAQVCAENLEMIPTIAEKRKLTLSDL